MNIFGDLRNAKSVRDVFGYLFAPPGWQPDGNGLTTENLRKQAAAIAPANQAVRAEAGLTVSDGTAT
jgi:hypothetical protein